MENTYVSSELTPSCNVPMDARSPSVESQQILATCLTHGAGMISVAGLRRGDRPQYILYSVGTAVVGPVSGLSHEKALGHSHRGRLARVTAAVPILRTEGGASASGKKTRCLPDATVHFQL